MPPRGSGKVFQTDAGTWAFRWREGGRQRYSGGHPSRDIAERALAIILGQLALERAGLPPDPKLVPRLEDLVPAWLDRRQHSHQAAAEDRSRWNRHLAPLLGPLRPSEVDTAVLRKLVEAKRQELAPGTVRVIVSLVSSIYEDLIERKLATENPARRLPRSLRRLIRPDHDPRTTPFLEKLSDVRRVYRKLRPPLDVAYAIGAMAGLRTGEVFALRWSHVDLEARRIHVRESVKGPLKDKDSRIVPVLDGLAPVLAAWKLKTKGTGRVIPPMRRDGTGVDKHTPGRYLAAALRDLGLEREGLGWYEATRHTFASQWVIAGGSIEKLKEILGHYSVVVTERYAHLRPEHFGAADHARIPLNLGTSDERMTRRPKKHRSSTRKRYKNAGAAL